MATRISPLNSCSYANSSMHKPRLANAQGRCVCYDLLQSSSFEPSVLPWLTVGAESAKTPRHAGSSRSEHEKTLRISGRRQPRHQIRDTRGLIHPHVSSTGGTMAKRHAKVGAKSAASSKHSPAHAGRSVPSKAAARRAAQGFPAPASAKEKRDFFKEIEDADVKITDAVKDDYNTWLG